MRVLVVDDSRTMRNFLTAIVRNLDLEADQASDGVEALERLESAGSYDLAMVDWDMPRMSGIEFVRAVRARPKYGNLKLLMVTGRTSFEEVAEAVSNGSDDFLMKPLTPAMVAEKFRILGLIA